MSRFIFLLAMTSFSLQFAQAKPEEKASVQILDQLNQIQRGTSPSCYPASIKSVPDDLKYACKDLALLACKPGSFDDGTGTARSRDEVEKKVAEIQSRTAAHLQTAILGALNNSNGKYDYIRKLSVSVTAQNGTPNCESVIPRDKKLCYQNVAALLAKTLATLQFQPFSQTQETLPYPPPQTGPEIDLESFEYLSNNQVFKEVIAASTEQAFKEIDQVSSNHKIRDKVFPHVKQILIEKINENVNDPKTKALMIEKIKNISYNGNSCGVLNGETSALFTKNAYYNPRNQEFRFCNGLLMESDSEFSLAAIIAHELTHSIDPCTIATPHAIGIAYTDKNNVNQCEKEYPIQNLISCLRTIESVGAMRLPVAPVAGTSSGTRNAASTQFRSDSPFCDQDQITESVSDWMSAEVLPEYMSRYHPGLTPAQKMTGYSNVYRSLCKPVAGDEARATPEATPFNVHPKNEDRINRIFLANDRIFHDMGCTDGDRDQKHPTQYCKAGAPVIGTRPPLPTIEKKEVPLIPELPPTPIDEVSKRGRQ